MRTRRGGSVGLYRLLTEHGEAVEADLQRFYGLPLTGLFSGTLTARRLVVLVRRMPEDSGTARAVHGEDAAWSISDHLLAHVADLLAAANWQRGGDKTIPRPKPLPRPGVGPKRLQLSGQEVQRRLLAQRGGD